MEAPSPCVMYILSDVGEQREPAEGADQRARGLLIHAVYEVIDHAKRRGTRASLLHRVTAHCFDEREVVGAGLIGNHVAQQATEKADVAIECLIRMCGHVVSVVGEVFRTRLLQW